MFRRLVILLVSIVVIAIGAPWLDGMWVKKNYLDMIAAFNADTTYTIKVLDYQRGWFQSRANISVERHSLFHGQQTKLYSLNVDQTITHGPFVYSNESKHWSFALAALQSKISTDFFANGTFLQENSLMFFNKSSETTFSLPLLNMMLPAGKLTLQNLSGSMGARFSDLHLDKLESVGKIDSLEVGNPLVAMLATHLTSQSDFNYESLYKLWSGTNVATVGKITLFAQGRQLAVIDELKIHTHLGVNNTMYSAGLTFGVDKLVSSSPLALNKSSISVACENLDATLLANLLEKMRKNQLEEDSNQFLGLLKPETNILFDVNYNTPLGHFLVKHGTINWPQDAFPLTKENIIREAYVLAEVRISISLLNNLLTQMDVSQLQHPNLQGDQLRVQVNEWIKRGYLLQSNDEYVANISAAAGKIKINGNEYKPITPETLTPINTAPGVSTVPSSIAPTPAVNPVQPTSETSPITTAPTPTETQPTTTVTPTGTPPNTNATPSLSLPPVTTPPATNTTTSSTMDAAATH